MPTYQSSPVWASEGYMQDYKPVERFQPRERKAGNVVIPGSDELSMELLKQMFGIGVGPKEGKRRLEMNKDTIRGDMGDYMGSKRKAYQGEGQPPSNYAAAEKRLQDMMKWTGGYVNPQRNLGDLLRMYKGFV